MSNSRAKPAETYLLTLTPIPAAQLHAMLFKYLNMLSVISQKAQITPSSH